jgi:hypothetical protein
LKERLFGLGNPQGNHGEDVKEAYFYLDNTPTHAWMQALYKYPHAAFPYGQLVAEHGRRGRDEPEFEIGDTGAFDESRYFDIFIEYAKAGPEDICIRIRAINRGPDPAGLTALPTLWFRSGTPRRRPARHPRKTRDRRRIHARLRRRARMALHRQRHQRRKAFRRP